MSISMQFDELAAWLDCQPDVFLVAAASVGIVPFGLDVRDGTDGAYVEVRTDDPEAGGRCAVATMLAPDGEYIDVPMRGVCVPYEKRFRLT